MRRELMSLTEMAKLGFADLGTVADRLVELEESGRHPIGRAAAVLGDAADPDQALDWLSRSDGAIPTRCAIAARLCGTDSLARPSPGSVVWRSASSCSGIRADRIARRAHRHPADSRGADCRPAARLGRRTADGCRRPSAVTRAGRAPGRLPSPAAAPGGMGSGSVAPGRRHRTSSPPRSPISPLQRWMPRWRWPVSTRPAEARAPASSVPRCSLRHGSRSSAWARRAPASSTT